LEIAEEQQIDARALPSLADRMVDFINVQRPQKIGTSIREVYVVRTFWTS
jgi:hypothetical protein